MPIPNLIPAAAATTAAAAAIATFVYASRNSQSQLFGRTLIAPPLPTQLALTFDDGPNPTATPQLLDLLAAHNIKATFFLIAQWAHAEPALVHRIAAEGHAIGNHTATHPNLSLCASTRIRQELTWCNETLEDLLGEPVTLFRPPFGARRPAVLRIARELGLTTLQWNLIVSDWKPQTPAALVTRITQGLNKNRGANTGTTLVLHDGSQHTPTADRLPTLEALTQLLPALPPETEFVLPLETDFVLPPYWQSPETRFTPSPSINKP